MRVFYREDDELILKEAVAVSVKRGQVLIEASSGDKRALIKPHHTWSEEQIENFLRAQATESLVNLEPLGAPAP